MFCPTPMTGLFLSAGNGDVRTYFTSLTYSSRSAGNGTCGTNGSKVTFFSAGNRVSQYLRYSKVALFSLLMWGLVFTARLVFLFYASHPINLNANTGKLNKLKGRLSLRETHTQHRSSTTNTCLPSTAHMLMMGACVSFLDAMSSPVFMQKMNKEPSLSTART